MTSDKLPRYRAYAEYLLGSLIALVIIGLVLPAFATEPHDDTAIASANANANTNVQNNSGGGQAASNLYNTDRSRAIGLANGSAYAPTCPPGLVPGKGKHRAHGSPLYAISATCDAPDASQQAAIEAQREHELALARLAIEAARAAGEAAKAQAEANRTATERICAQSQFSCGVAK